MSLAPFIEYEARRLLAMLTTMHGSKMEDLPPRIANLIKALEAYLK